MLHLEKDNFNEIISKGTHLVDFYAEWCGPCKMLMPILEELDEKINIIKVNVDEHEDLAREYGIMSIPTLIFFKDGDIKKEIVGFKSKEELENIIDNI
jgi:thioredoxin 1